MLPPFHQIGDPEGDFYALAFCEGEYVSPSGSTREEASLVLYYSPSEDFTDFSFHICARDGRLIAYSRGIDKHDTLEFALWSAWYNYGLAPHQWRLYPAESMERYWSGVSDASQSKYMLMRTKFCSLLYHVRLKAHSKVKPLFEPSRRESTGSPFDPTPENEEIFRAACEDVE